MTFELLALTPLLAGVVLSSSSNKAFFLVAQFVNQEVHDRCLEAKDYAGCVKSNGGPSSVGIGGSDENKDSGLKENCSVDNVCVAERGTDQLGFPKVIGWTYKYSPSSNVVRYWKMPPMRVPHKGQPDRYVALNYIEHYYQRPIAATAGYYLETSPKKKACFPASGGGTWINGQWKPNSAGKKCTTTEAQKTWVPGTPAVKGGPRSRSWIQVFDCKDKTKARYVDGSLRGNWPTISPGESAFCFGRSGLKSLDMKL